MDNADRKEESERQFLRRLQKAIALLTVLHVASTETRAHAEDLFL
jgi:hypothetical protein